MLSRVQSSAVVTFVQSDNLQKFYLKVKPNVCEFFKLLDNYLELRIETFALLEWL